MEILSLRFFQDFLILVLDELKIYLFQVHRLRVTLRENRPDIVYLISVATRTARGRYRATTVVTLSPRYQLHNRSSYTLELAQRCFTTTVVSEIQINFICH